MAKSTPDPRDNNFLHTSRNVSLQGSILVAECQTGTGEWKEATLDLHRGLVNSRGFFFWTRTVEEALEEPGCFVDARDVHLHWEQSRDRQNLYLRALLPVGNGLWSETETALMPKISNVAGELEFTEHIRQRKRDGITKLAGT